MREDYSVSERDMTFVARADDRLWNYCIARHRKRWNVERNVPFGVMNDGKMGWWFPKEWVLDFTDDHGQQTRTVRTIVNDPPRRNRFVAAATKSFARVMKHEAISANEARSWQLPEGSQITPWEVTYPDGTRESIDALRARHGTYRPVPMRSAEQENLEAILNAIQRDRRTQAA